MAPLLLILLHREKQDTAILKTKAPQVVTDPHGAGFSRNIEAPPSETLPILEPVLSSNIPMKMDFVRTTGKYTVTSGCCPEEYECDV